MIHFRYLILAFICLASSPAIGGDKPAQTEFPFCEKLVFDLSHPIFRTLETWLPNGFLRLAPGDQSQKPGANAEDAKEKFSNLFQAMSAHPDYAWYPLAYFSGGVAQELKPQDLEGRLVAGFQDWFPYESTKAKAKRPLIPDQSAERSNYFYWGTVTGAEYLGVSASFHVFFSRICDHRRKRKWSKTTV